MSIYVATVSSETNEGRLVMLRRVPHLSSKKGWKLMGSITVKTDRELVRAWELLGERIVDDTVAEIREKEEK